MLITTSIQIKDIAIAVLGLIFSAGLAIIGASNDTANTFGTSQGSKIVTIRQAKILGATLDLTGALLFGIFVAATLATGITSPSNYSSDPASLAYVMFLTELASAITLLSARFLKLPISSTHGMCSALIALCIVSKDIYAVKWNPIGYKLLAGWILSPIVSGIITYCLKLFLHYTIAARKDKIKAIKIAQPILMTFSIFITALFIFSLGPSFIQLPMILSIIVSIAIGIVISSFYKVYSVCYKSNNKVNKKLDYYNHDKEIEMNPINKDKKFNEQSHKSQNENLIEKKTDKKFYKRSATLLMLQNNFESTIRAQINSNEVLPRHFKQCDTQKNNEYIKQQNVLLLISACTVGFAHGANNVGNSSGPFAIILNVVLYHNITNDFTVPMQLQLIFGLCMSFGILIWGHRTLKTIGDNISTLRSDDAYASQTGGSIGILLSSAFGLPISTSHTNIGSIIGLGMAIRTTGKEYPMKWKTIINIFLVAIYTIPMSATIAVFMQYLFGFIFFPLTY